MRSIFPIEAANVKLKLKMFWVLVFLIFQCYCDSLPCFITLDMISNLFFKIKEFDFALIE